jgi:hypothetical protein
MAVASLRRHTDAVIDKLEAAGLRVGNAEGKDASGNDLSDNMTTGYAVVFRISGRMSGTLGALHDDADLVFQVTCVGKTAEQADWVVDKAMTLLSGVTITGRYIIPFIDEAGSVRRDDSGPDTLFYATPRFRLVSVPA